MASTTNSNKTQLGYTSTNMATPIQTKMASVMEHNKLVIMINKVLVK